MGLRKWAYRKPKSAVKNEGTGHKLLNGLVFAGTKVGQWTVRPGIKAYDVGRGKKK